MRGSVLPHRVGRSPGWGTGQSGQMQRMNTFTSVGLAVLGVFFMVMAFVAMGVRGAFSRRGPGRPPTKTERTIFFLVGLAALIKGFRMLFV
jgi:hypothetical protein